MNFEQHEVAFCCNQLLAVCHVCAYVHLLHDNISTAIQQCVTQMYDIIAAAQDSCHARLSHPPYPPPLPTPHTLPLEKVVIALLQNAQLGRSTSSGVKQHIAGSQSCRQE